MLSLAHLVTQVETQFKKYIADSGAGNKADYKKQHHYNLQMMRMGGGD